MLHGPWCHLRSCPERGLVRIIHEGPATKAATVRHHPPRPGGPGGGPTHAPHTPPPPPTRAAHYHSDAAPAFAACPRWPGERASRRGPWPNQQKRGGLSARPTLGALLSILGSGFKQVRLKQVGLASTCPDFSPQPTCDNGWERRKRSSEMFRVSASCWFLRAHGAGAACDCPFCRTAAAQI